jgi:prenyltransferase beta subunit
MRCLCGEAMKRLDCKGDVWFCEVCGRNYDGEFRLVFCDEAHAHTKSCTVAESQGQHGAERSR